MIGTNNTVMRVNSDFATSSVLADDDSDPGFFAATHLASGNPTAAGTLYHSENF